MYDEISVSSLNSQDQLEIQRKVQQDLEDYQIESMYKEELKRHQEEEDDRLSLIFQRSSLDDSGMKKMKEQIGGNDKQKEKKWWEEKLEEERQKFRKEEEQCLNGYKKCQEYIEEIKRSNKENVEGNIDEEAVFLQSSDKVPVVQIEESFKVKKNLNKVKDQMAKGVVEQGGDDDDDDDQQVSFEVVEEDEVNLKKQDVVQKPKKLDTIFEAKPSPSPIKTQPPKPIQQDEQEKRKIQKQLQQQRQTQQKLRNLQKKQQQTERIQKQQMRARLKILEQQKIMNQIMNMTLQDQLSLEYQKQTHLAKFSKLYEPLPKLPDFQLKIIKQAPEKIKAREERKKQRELLQAKEERSRLLKEKRDGFRQFIKKRNNNKLQVVKEQEKQNIENPFDCLEECRLITQIGGKLLNSTYKLPNPFNSKQYQQHSSQIQSISKFHSDKFKQSFNQASIFEYIPINNTYNQFKLKEKEYEQSLLKLAQEKQNKKLKQNKNEANLQIIKQMDDFEQSYNNLPQSIQSNSLASILPIYAKSTDSIIEIKTPYEISQVNGITAYPVLKSLSLTSCKIMSLEAFNNQHFPYLQQLNFYQSKINHIPNQCFNGMAKTLTSLSFELTNLSRIQPAIARLKNLRLLNLSRTNSIAKIENLQSLTKLEVLNLQVNRITKLQGLDNCINLKILQLGNNKIQNVQYLSTQNNSKVLLPLLTDLSLFKNQIEIWPVSNVNLYFLRNLTLSDNKLATFSLAGWSPFLESLNLSENLIFSLNGLHLAPNIQQLDISFNKINSPASLMKNLIWVSGSLKKLKLNDNPFWRDAAMVGESLAQIELSQQSELVKEEREMWKRFIIEIAPKIEEFNNIKIFAYNKKLDSRLFNVRCMKQMVSENASSQLLFRNSYLMKSSQFAYYWRKKNAKIFIKQSIPFKTLLMRSKMQNYFSNLYMGVVKRFKNIQNLNLNACTYSLQCLYKNTDQLKHHQRSLSKITSLLSKKVLRKKIILKRASQQPKKLIKLQSFLRGFLTRVNYGESVQHSRSVGLKKYRLLDPKHQAARKIQKHFRKFIMQNKIKKALVNVGKDQFQIENLLKDIEGDEIADFIDNPDLFDEEEKKMLQQENDANLFGVQFNQENYQKFIEARKNLPSFQSSSKVMNNQNMLQSNNQYFYNNNNKDDGDDNLTQIDAKSQSSFGGASMLQSQRRLVKKNNLMQSNGYSTPFKSKNSAVNQSQSQFNHSPSSFLNIPNGQELMNLERKKMMQEKKKMSSEIKKVSQEWGFANQETKKLLAMRKQKKMKMQEKSKKLSSEEKFMKFKINQERVKQKGQSLKPPLRPERISYF